MVRTQAYNQNVFDLAINAFGCVLIPSKVVRVGGRRVGEVGHEIILQREGAAGSFCCRAFSGVPAARRSLIVLTSSGSDAARRLVRELAEELEGLLLGSSPEAAVVDIDCPPHVADM